MEKSKLVLIFHSNTGGFDDNGTICVCIKQSSALAFLLTLPTILENMAFRSPRGDYYRFTVLHPKSGQLPYYIYATQFLGIMRILRIMRILNRCSSRLKK